MLCVRTSRHKGIQSAIADLTSVRPGRPPAVNLLHKALRPPHRVRNRHQRGGNPLVRVNGIAAIEGGWHVAIDVGPEWNWLDVAHYAPKSSPACAQARNIPTIPAMVFLGVLDGRHAFRVALADELKLSAEDELGLSMMKEEGRHLSDAQSAG